MIKDGFEISAKVYMLIDGETPATMAKSTGLGLELPNIFEKLKPSLVLTVEIDLKQWQLLWKSLYEYSNCSHWEAKSLGVLMKV